MESDLAPNDRVPLRQLADSHFATVRCLLIPLLILQFKYKEANGSSVRKSNLRSERDRNLTLTVSFENRGQK
jgi:hypothetical protein